MNVRALLAEPAAPSVARGWLKPVGLEPLLAGGHEPPLIDARLLLDPLAESALEYTARPAADAASTNAARDGGAAARSAGEAGALGGRAPRGAARWAAARDGGAGATSAGVARGGAARQASTAAREGGAGGGSAGVASGADASGGRAARARVGALRRASVTGGSAGTAARVGARGVAAAGNDAAAAGSAATARGEADPRAEHKRGLTPFRQRPAGARAGLLAAASEPQRGQTPFKEAASLAAAVSRAVAAVELDGGGAQAARRVVAAEPGAERRGGRASNGATGVAAAAQFEAPPASVDGAPASEDGPVERLTVAVERALERLGDPAPAEVTWLEDDDELAARLGRVLTRQARAQGIGLT